MNEIIRRNTRNGYLRLTRADIGKKVAFGTDPTVKDRLWDNKVDMLWTVLDVFSDGTALLLLNTELSQAVYLPCHIDETFEWKHAWSDYDREKIRKRKENECFFDHEKGYAKLIDNFMDRVFTQSEREIIVTPTEAEKQKLCMLDKSEVVKYKDIIFSIEYLHSYDCIQGFKAGDERDGYDEPYSYITHVYCDKIWNDGSVRFQDYRKYEFITTPEIRPAIKVYTTKEASEMAFKEAERKRKEQEESERIMKERAEEEMKKKKEEIASRRRANGVCQYCGGKFGLFKKVCKKCGRRKDY